MVLIKSRYCQGQKLQTLYVVKVFMPYQRSGLTATLKGPVNKEASNKVAVTSKEGKDHLNRKMIKSQMPDVLIS
jgi:stage III sporulation protein SpoIIIAA